MRALLVTAAVLVALAGCAHPLVLHALGPDGHTVNATYAGPLTHRVVFPDSNFTFDLPGKQAPAIRASKLFAGCGNRQDGVCPLGDSGSSTVVYLARITTIDLGGMNDRLVYAIVSKYFTCLPAGPGPTAPGASPHPIKPSRCFAITLVDAMTGRGLGTSETDDTNEFKIVDGMH